MHAKRIIFSLIVATGVVSIAVFVFHRDGSSIRPNPDRADVDPLPAKAAEPSRYSPEAEKKPEQAPTANRRGVLISSQNKTVSGGDILYKFMPRRDGSCESTTMPSFDLDAHTGAVQSNERGRFDIPRPGSQGEHNCLHLNASKEGYVATVVSLDLDTFADTIELELEKHETIRGRVTTPGGRAMEGATVRSWIGNAGEVLSKKTEPCDVVDYNSLVSAQSVDDGNFSLGIAGDNQFCLQASHPDWASSSRQLISSDEAKTSEFNLTLEFPTEVAGRAVDQDGMPVPNLALELRPLGNAPDSGPVVSYTGSAGEFVFRELNAADYELHSTNDDYAVAKPKEISLKSGESLSDLKVSVFPVTTITGRLVDNRGNPLSAAQVSTRSPYLPELSTTSALSDDSGRFEVKTEHRSDTVRDMLRMANEFSEDDTAANNEDRPPLVCISFYHPQFRSDDLSVTVSDASLDIGTVYMDEPQLTISGSVENHRGEPTEAQLTFSYVDSRRNSRSEPPLRCRESTSSRKIQSDEQGEFGLHLDRPGRYEVEVKTDRYKPRRVEVDVRSNGDVIDIKLD